MRVLKILHKKHNFANVNTNLQLVTRKHSVSRSNKSTFTSHTTSMSPPSPPSLTVVPTEEYQQFADALREFRPHSYQIESMLRGHLKYDYLSLLGASLYAPASGAHRHHLAIISPSGSTNERCMLSIYWNDHHLSDEDVCLLLKNLPINSWHQPIMIRQIPSHLQPKMDAILLKLSEGDLHLFAHIPVHVYALVPEDTPPVPELPDGYYFGSLNGDHGKEILPRWPEAPTETFECFKKYLDTLPSAAVFRKMDSTDAPESHAWNKKHTDELVSYTVFKPGTDVGITYTTESHRRKGLAKAATLQLAHKLHRDGLPVTGLADVGYGASIQLHTSMGFKYYTDAAFPFYLPKQFNDFSSRSSFSNFEKSFPESMKRWEEKWKVN